MDDLISRKALYEKTARWELQAMALLVNAQAQGKTDEMLRLSTVLQERTAFKHDVADAPSAQKTGKWINCKYPLGECSECNAIVDIQNNEANYCPVCGSRNRGEEDGRC